MHKRLRAFAFILVAGTLLVGCTTTPSTNTNTQTSASSSTEAMSPSEVTIASMAFAPAELHVKVGDTVTWTNNDSIAHSVVSDTGSSENFTSSTLSVSDQFSHTFNQTGEFSYHCGIHPSMTGKIVVE